MALLLIPVAWLLLLWLVVGLCRAARLGDRHPGHAEPATVASEPQHAVLPRASATTSRRGTRQPAPALEASGLRL
jgi:hypothetical protein